MTKTFGEYVRSRREELRLTDPSYSVRQVAYRIGVQPAYLSSVERGLQSPPSEEKIRLLARELNEDPDVLLAMAGKVSADLLEVIRTRPKLFARLIRELKHQPDRTIDHVTRQVRDGDW
ncbi:MAG: helix-turn-helix domain-containing protein [Deltaproteobacteria bacterium]|nr:helix-turn-helix domain-containing protein [Candidatus Zymogenaceae bacterium]